MRGIPVEVTLGPDDGVPHKTVANADTIAIVRKVFLEGYLTTLAPVKLEVLAEALRFAFDFS